MQKKLQSNNGDTRPGLAITLPDLAWIYNQSSDHFKLSVERSRINKFNDSQDLETLLHVISKPSNKVYRGDITRSSWIYESNLAPLFHSLFYSNSSFGTICKGFAMTPRSCSKKKKN